MNKKMLYATVSFLAVITCLTLVYSLTDWNKTFEWSLNAQGFEVYEDSEFTLLWDSGGDSISLGSVNVGDVVTKSFYVKNIGGDSITVTPNAVTTAATVSWDKPSALISVGGSDIFVLTLTITSAGSCVVSFSGV